jgi:hypothetical protein
MERMDKDGEVAIFSRAYNQNRLFEMRWTQLDG